MRAAVQGEEAWATATWEAFPVDRGRRPEGPAVAEAEAEAGLGCASAAAGLAQWSGETLRFDCG